MLPKKTADYAKLTTEETTKELDTLILLRQCPGRRAVRSIFRKERMVATMVAVFEVSRAEQHNRDIKENFI
jgi:hypothetical protein